MVSTSVPKPNGYNRARYVRLRDSLRAKGINTVCIEANCPNRYECFSNGTATFMILGKVCTRNCRYCNVAKGNPVSVESEPHRIAQQVAELGLKYVVITSVTRDDLEDGGASIFAKCVKEIRARNPEVKIELLIPDFNGNWSALRKIVNLKVDVLNHNIETVQKLYPKLRPEADYQRCLELLRKVKALDPGQKTKSGIMVGLGENKEELKKTINDIRGVGCTYLSIGQYLAPSDAHTPVVKQYSEREFRQLKKYSEIIGFEHVESGPLVRSSYKAHTYS